MLTRRWFYLVPRAGEPTLLVHAIELGSFPPGVPGRRVRYASWHSLREALRALLEPLRGRRVAMEYFPEAAIPALSRVDAGTLEVVRSHGVEVASSADMVQRFVCRWTPHQLASHVRALRAIDDAKDAAFAYVGESHKRGLDPSETQVQALLVKRFADAGLVTDHPPIVAVNGHAGDPHYVPSERTPTPIRKGDLLLIDLWAKGKDPGDVYADITWVGYCGDRPPPKLEEIFRVAAEGRDLGLATVEAAWREKRTLQGWQVDRAVRDHVVLTTEYRTLSQIRGPLIFIERTADVAYNEIVEIVGPDNDVRLGQVLEVDQKRCMVRIFIGTSGLDLERTRVRFTGDVARLGVSLSMLGRVLDGAGQPIDGGPPIIPERSLDINGLPINPSMRTHPSEFIQTGVSAIDGLNTLTRGQKLPIFSGAGLPANELAAQVASQARVVGGDNNKGKGSELPRQCRPGWSAAAASACSAGNGRAPASAPPAP